MTNKETMDTILTTNNGNDKEPLSLAHLRKLLEQQYDVTLEYCNSLTLIHNTTTTSSSSSSSSRSDPTASTSATTHNNNQTRVVEYDQQLHMALEHLMTQVSRVQQHRQQLERYASSTCSDHDSKSGGEPIVWPSALQELVVEHVERTRRILSCLHHPGNPFLCDAHGIPVATNNNDNDGATVTDVQTLALSTLRASVQTLLQSMDDGQPP